MTTAELQELRKLVNDTVAAGFLASRMPRSVAYIEGVRALLMLRATGARLLCEHRPGTAECDAFFAGVEEGKDWWRHQVEQLVATRATQAGAQRPQAAALDEVMRRVRKGQAREALGLYPQGTTATVLRTGGAA